MPSGLCKFCLSEVHKCIYSCNNCCGSGGLCSPSQCARMCNSAHPLRERKTDQASSWYMPSVPRRRLALFTFLDTFSLHRWAFSPRRIPVFSHCNRAHLASQLLASHRHSRNERCRTRFQKGQKHAFICSVFSSLAVTRMLR